MGIQKTAWGQVEWLTSADSAVTSKVMSVGLATIWPHMRQESHIHYEVEQFIYILQGAGYELVDGKRQSFEKGMFYYLPANITHEIINPGDEEVVHLLISVPTGFHEPPESEREDAGNASGSFYGAVEAVRNQLTENSSLPITIFDDMGNLVLQNDKYPEYCMAHCDPVRKQGKCACFSTRKRAEVSTGNVGEVCPYGLTVFHIPIQYKNQFLGSIFSGHILLGDDRTDRNTGMYDTPLGTMLAIQKWMRNVAKSITSFCGFDALRQSLNQKDQLLAQNRQARSELEADLQAMRNTVTNLKINRHFLFNTLNAIAGQALEGDRITTYQTIVDLAKMFRYSASSDLQVVPLSSELEYLDTYLHMQRLRYGGELTATLTCEENAYCGLVPFNFLQPVVENAFVHGFADFSGHKNLDIRISAANERLSFLIVNNGTPIDKVTLKRVCTGMTSNSGHGMSLVFSKLEAVYGKDFSIDIFSSQTQGTKIRLELPYHAQWIGGAL